MPRRKYDLSQFVKFVPCDRVKSDVFKSKHFNVVVICLDEAYEITPHHEPYDMLFYVASGEGKITVGKRRYRAGPGSMIYAPAGVRGIECIERMVVIGIQEPH